MDVNKIENKYFKKILYKAEVDSTNNWAKRFYFEHPNSNNIVFLADEQSAGKGRYKHKWNCEPHKQINMSILLSTQIEVKYLQIICICTALAVSRAIFKISSIKCNIKWPNDILIGTRKICGILCESLLMNENNAAVIVGIGVNVNNDKFDKSIEKKSTSLFLESNEYFSRTELINMILENFTFYYNKFNLSNHFDIINEYRQKCCTLNKTIQFKLNDSLTQAKAIDITSDGNLVVKLESGAFFTINHGEIIEQHIYNERTTI